VKQQVTHLGSGKGEEVGSRKGGQAQAFVAKEEAERTMQKGSLCDHIEEGSRKKRERPRVTTEKTARAKRERRIPPISRKSREKITLKRRGLVGRHH